MTREALQGNAAVFLSQHTLRPAKTTMGNVPTYGGRVEVAYFRVDCPQKVLHFHLYVVRRVQAQAVWTVSYRPRAVVFVGIRTFVPCARVAANDDLT